MSTAEERMQNEIDELEQENRLLRARNTRLEAEAKVVSVQEPLTDSFVQLVPDKCDRIVWRGSYHHLPPAAQRQWVGLTDEDKLTVRRIPWETLGDLMDNIEAKLKEKNS